MSALPSKADMLSINRCPLSAISRHSFRGDSKTLERDSQVFLLRNPAQLTSFLIREVPCLGQELRLRWLSASIVFAREILSEKLGRVCRLVIGYGVVGAGQTDDDLVVPHLKLNT